MKGMGWIKQKPDSRDYTFDHPKVKARFDEIRAKGLASSIDLRPNCSPIVDQGNLGSCTANAGAGDVEFIELHQSKSYVAASRLFLYYVTRHLIENTSGDVGAEIRDVIKALVKYGVCTEKTWAYIESKLDTKPPTAAFTEATAYETLTYAAPQNLTDIQTALNGSLIVQFGFTVFDSFENIGSDGIMPMPDMDNESVLGGHAVDVVGYLTKNKTQYLIVRNSWGTSWGDKGYFYMPFAYLNIEYEGSPVCDDFWTILTEDYLNNPVPTPTPTPVPPTPTPIPPSVDVAGAIVDLDKAIPILKKSGSKYVIQARPMVIDALKKLGG